MKLREANFQVERKNNELDKLLKDKELLECLVEPKGTDYTKVVVDGGKHTNILEVYVALKDLKRWKNLDKRIQRLQSEIQNLIDWIDNELKILDKYNEIEELIIYYKEISIKKYTWQEIANKVHYSKDYCRKIYKRCEKKRNI